MTSPTIDGSVSAAASGSFSTTSGLSTSGANRVICAIIWNEQTVQRTVSSITATGLTFTNRLAYSGQDPGRAGSHFCSLELWTAPASAQLTSTTFSISMSGTFDDGGYVIFGAAGCNSISSPLDSNASSKGTGTGTTITFSTTQANDLIIGAWASSFSGNPGNNPPTGWTLVNWNNTGGGSLFSDEAVFSKSVSATQSSVTATTGNSSCANLWFALSADAPSVSASFNLTGQQSTTSVGHFTQTHTKSPSGVHATSGVGRLTFVSVPYNRAQVPTPIVPPTMNNLLGWAHQTNRLLNQALSGKINVIGDFTFSASTYFTTLIDSRISVNSIIFLMPLTADAASAAGSSYWFSNQTKGQVDVNHENVATTDRSYRVLILG